MLHVRVITLDGAGAGSASVPPCRLASLQNGTLTNRGNTFTPGDRTPAEEEFINGPLVASGDPDAVVSLWLHYPGS